MKYLTLTLVIYLAPCLHSETLNQNLLVFDHLINPVFEARCQHCHGPNKDKGKLRMDSKALLLKGGRGAGTEIIVGGDVEASELVYRITLPADDEEAMPPMEEGEKHNPVTEEELSVIKSWIELGASFDLKISELDESARKMASLVLKNLPAKKAEAHDLTAPKLPIVPQADKQVIAAIENIGILVMPVAENTNTLYVNASYIGKNFDDTAAKALLPISEQILWLNLAKTGITDKSGPLLSTFKNLTRLHLEGTNISDAFPPFLSNLQNIEYLNLYSTGLTDSSIPHFQKLKKLQKIFLWKTNITAAGVDLFRESFTDRNTYLSIKNKYKKMKDDFDKFSLREKKRLSALETEVQKANESSQDKISINSQCPVSGKPSNLNISCNFEGRKISFCSEDDKAKFLKDSESYRSKIKDFSPSIAYKNAFEALKQARAQLDIKIKKESVALRKVTHELNSIGPEINLGWTHPTN